MTMSGIRPPRPTHIDPALLADIAQLLAMKLREIIDVRDVEEGTLVTTHDGTVMIVVPEDRPDPHGQTGTLTWQLPANGLLPVAARVYAGSPASGDVVMAPGPGEGWTVADLQLAASREMIPAPTGAADPYGNWLAEDPIPGIRAMALWNKVAADNGLTLMAAAQRFPLTARYRDLVLRAGLLDESEAARL